MSTGFAILCLAPLAVTAALTSIVVGAALRSADRWIGGLAPAAQARLLLAATLAPAFTSVALLCGWAADLLVFRCTAHHCLRDHVEMLPSIVVMLLVGGFLARTLDACARVGVGLWRSRVARRALDDAASVGAEGLRVLQLDEPQAFVLGLLRPAVYVSRGMFTAAGGAYLSPVLAHERAHVRRRDPLRRVLARVGLAFHLPGIATWLEGRLARAQEMAADTEAARAVGDGSQVAEVLVRLARWRMARPVSTPALASFGDYLEARVRDLLVGGPRPDSPGRAAIWTVAFALLTLAICAADPIHACAEALMRFLDG